MSQQHELSNYDRLVRFRGERIAHATSRTGQDSSRIRWTEVDIYRTQGGSYLVHKVGKSRVFHGGSSPCSKTGGKRTTARQVHYNLSGEEVMDLTPCPVCKPGELLSLPPHTAIYVEQDRATVHTSSTAAGAVESARSVDSDGVVYIPRVAERALREASQSDPALREAFMVEEVA